MTFVRNTACFAFLIFSTFLLESCTTDVLPEPQFCASEQPTYDGLMKEIIDESCAYAGCHDGQGGIGPGDYTTYEGILPALNSGDVQYRVIEVRDNPAIGMPPDESVYPESRVDTLSTRELELFTCWLDSGFPRN
ncbi:MAG: hypothetical protein R3350_05985 [Saprospiraceae bacterium]|nr:hypothetical protein [Saprospiraceae bacterium]